MASMASMVQRSKGALRQAIDRCDSIEGFDPRRPDDGLYRRTPRTPRLLSDALRDGISKFCQITIDSVSK